MKLSTARTYAQRLLISPLARNVVLSIGGQAGQSALAVLGAVAVKYVSLRLGPDALGILYFNLALNVLLYGLFESGTSSTTIREISRYSETDPAYIRDLVRTVACYYWGAFWILTIGMYCLAPTMVKTWIHLTTLDETSAIQGLRWLSASALTALPRSVYVSVFRGLQRIGVSITIDIITVFVLQLGTIVVSLGHGSLLTLSIWYLICYGVSTGVYLIACGRCLTWRVILPKVSFHIVRRNAKFQKNMLWISILGILTAQADKLAISRLLPIRLLGPYGFAGSLVVRVNTITNVIAGAALPSFSTSFEGHDRNIMIAQFRKLQDFVCILTLPLFAAVCYAAMPLFTYSFGRDTARDMALPVLCLALGYYLNTALNIPYILCLAAGKPEILVKSSVLSFVVMLPITTLSVLHYGVVGAAISWLFCQLISCAYLVPRICSECIGISTISWLTAFGRTFGLGAASYGGGWLTLIVLRAHSLAALVAVFTGSSIFFGAGALWVAGPELRSVAMRSRGLVIAARSQFEVRTPS